MSYSLYRSELGIYPISNPFDYVKELQSHFDNSNIKYSAEYYEVLGIERD